MTQQPPRSSHPRWSATGRTGLALTAAALLALAACGDDSDDGNDNDSESTTAEPAPTTTTTHPSATDDEAEAFAIVEDIFHEHGELVDDLYQNPELIDDPDSTHIERLRELTTGDAAADHLDTLIDNVQTMVEHNQRREATGTVMSDSAIGNLTAEDSETITFELCSMYDYQVVDEDGEPFYDPSAVATFGVGEAQLVNGYWRIVELLRDPRISLESDMLEPGFLEPGMCDIDDSGVQTAEGTEE